MSHMESSKYGSTWTWIITALTEYINGWDQCHIPVWCTICNYLWIQQKHWITTSWLKICLGCLTNFMIILLVSLPLAFFTNFGVSISMNPDRTASRKLFWLLNVMRPEPEWTKVATLNYPIMLLRQCRMHYTSFETNSIFRAKFRSFITGHVELGQHCSLLNEISTAHL